MTYWRYNFMKQLAQTLTYISSSSSSSAISYFFYSSVGSLLEIVYSSISYFSGSTLVAPETFASSYSAATNSASF